MKKMCIVGLTGQSGAGKTTVSQLFIKQGLAVIDCDKVARLVTARGSECNKKLSLLFPDCFDSNMTLDRKKLGGIVFADKKKLLQLNNAIFPFITKFIEGEINRLEEMGVDIVVLDAPTLFESGIDKKCDLIVSVVAEQNIRLKRIVNRDNISPSQVEKRFESQHGQDFFIGNSDYIIENNGEFDAVYNRTQGVINKIKEHAHGDNKNES